MMKENIFQYRHAKDCEEQQWKLDKVHSGIHTNNTVGVFFFLLALQPIVGLYFAAL